jgi:peptide/nickel transport system substrate-binding protein
MKKFRWQLLIILITGIVVGVLLIIQQLDETETIESTPSPIAGGIYTEALIGEFMRLNPFLDIYNQPDHDVDQLIFNSLIRFDSRGIPQSELAESWGVSRDGTIYNFSLRTNVFWHDGEIFDASDVLLSIDLMKSQHQLIPEDLQNFWEEVEVVVLSDSQLQFLLPEPFAPFLDYVTFGILPEHIFAGLSLDEIIDHPFNLEPIGTGPFKFNRLLAENDQIVGVVLDAFDDYFLDRPYLDEINFRYYPTSELAFEAYENGEVEGIGIVNDSILQDVLAQPELSIYTARKPMLTMVYLNLDNPEVEFLQTPNFRIALMASINRDRIIANVYNGQAIPASGPIMPGTWAHYLDIETIHYDPVRAENLFESTGVTFDEEASTFLSESGTPIQLSLLYPETELHQGIAEQIESDWEALGIEVTLVPKPYEDVLSDLAARDYQTCLVDINLTSSPDPDPYPFWGQAQMDSGQNYAEWDNRSASELLEQARLTMDFAERGRLYRNFQVVFMRELPSLPIFYPVYTYAVMEDIKGINFGPIFDVSDRFNNVHNWYILQSLTTQSTPTSEESTP